MALLFYAIQLLPLISLYDKFWQLLAICIIVVELYI